CAGPPHPASTPAAAAPATTARNRTMPPVPASRPPGPYGFVGRSPTRGFQGVVPLGWHRGTGRSCPLGNEQHEPARGDEGNRYPNPCLAKAVLCQLSYVPAVPANGAPMVAPAGARRRDPSGREGGAGRGPRRAAPPPP